MSADNAFGEIFIERSIEEAVETILTDKLDMYMAEVMRIRGITDTSYFPHVADGVIVPTSEIETKPGGQFPEILIVCPGTVKDPVAFGDGHYKGTWGLGIVVMVKSTDQIGARTAMECWAAAITACLMQNKTLEDTVDRLEWKGRNFDETPAETSRTLGVAMIRFEATVIGVIDALAIPNSDNEAVGHPDHHNDPGDYETVAEANLTIDTY